MEHEAGIDLEAELVWKITTPGGFGRFPTLIDGKISMRSSSPLEYLKRLSMSNEIFADDWRVVGVLIDRGLVRIVTSQPLVVGERPEQEEIDAYLNALGYFRIGQEHAYRHRQQLLGLFDTHKGNFLRGTSGQVFAIDVIPANLTDKTWRMFGSW
ncbi:MAG: hypothetical protein ACI8UO_000230 [Verrucomicrobiales bacterium]|jgi:hypothetical protein